MKYTIKLLLSTEKHIDMKNFSHPLMSNNINQSDLNEVKKLLKKPNTILTQSKNVKEFEKKWSKWLGCKYSIFVNSGSSANYLTFAILQNFYKPNSEIIVPTLTWVSDIVSVIRNGFKPVFVDIDMKTLSMSHEDIKRKITKNTKAIFLTHAQGFSGIDSKLLKLIKKKKIDLIEDVCESHGAKYKKTKLGNFGLISNFSFYYAHHLSTIEGGMICTNDKKIYQMALMMRSHGMLREIRDDKLEKKIIKKNKQLSPKFIFMYPGFNFRNNEIGATIGLNQLKRLDSNNLKRTKNFKYFVSRLNKDKYYTDFMFEGSCNYAFPIILKTKNLHSRNYFENILKKNNIEFRRGNAGGGNQVRQPYLKKILLTKFGKKILKEIIPSKYRNTEHVHFFGYYIGNYPSLEISKIKKICEILNKIEFK